jgi:type II secretory pathway component PulK
MVIGTFYIPKAKEKSKVIKTRDALDVAARYFVYKVYEATDGPPKQWQVLHGMGESAATISRAIERGWVVLQEVTGKPPELKAALTAEGRRLARRGR